MMERHARIGVIGGSGLYAMEGLRAIEEVRMRTPFGDPSDAIMLGELSGVPVAFLPRHGRGHRLTPTEVPSRANMYALKTLGVEWVISVSAVGSLREDYAPLDLVVPDQLFDRTKSRPNSFFEGGVVAHVGFAEPFCPHLSGLLWETMRGLGDVRVHNGGTLLVIEGPLFSTKAESRIYRQWGCDLIGMTALPEAKLAREAELHYATIACVTDYDVWHESAEHVTVEMVVANLTRNVANAQRILREVVARIPEAGTTLTCGCGSALANALMTDRALISMPLREKYGLLLGKYLAE
ncbi:MAG: 5'-methylthioadenosine phosphorylase [Ktedonobacterales bacterium]|jgi:5'-methylthioadenosine phosphorylase|nr:MAG: 5'-methylthioadenosine phosphorylase [Ktedonobacterales bacterium]